MSPILKNIHNFAKKKDLSYYAYIGLLTAFVTLIFTIVCKYDAKNYEQRRKEEYKLNWERIVDSNGHVTPIYRARIYGGWLVKSYDDIIFISLNHPENWILEK